QTSPLAFAPLDFLDTNSGIAFPAASILSANAWPDQAHEGPTGVSFSQANYPSLANDIYNTKRAELLGERVSLFLGAIVDPNGQFYGANLPQQYYSQG